MEQMLTALESISRAINQSAKELEQCKDLSQKKTHAEIIKLLCESMGIFFDAMGDYGPYPFEDFDDDFDDDFELERRKSKKGGKKGKKEDIPF